LDNRRDSILFFLFIFIFVISEYVIDYGSWMMDGQVGGFDVCMYVDVMMTMMLMMMMRHNICGGYVWKGQYHPPNHFIVS